MLTNMTKYSKNEIVSIYVSYCLLYFFSYFISPIFFFFLIRNQKRKKNFHHFLLHRWVWLGRKEKVVSYMKLLTTK